MASLSFRPRPLDVNRPIPIIRKELDDEPIDLNAISRSVPIMPTGMENEEESEKHIQQAITEKNKEIPIPGVRILEEYDNAPNPNPFMKPQSYIRFKDKTPEEFDESLEYDLDDDDEAFVNKVNAAAGKKVLLETKFELLIDRFEKMMYNKNDKFPSLDEVIQGLPSFKPNMIEFVYKYWVHKRKKWAHSFNTRLIRPPDPDDPNPYKAFRTRNEEKMKKRSRKNDQFGYQRLKQLRNEMERSRMILEMIKKREKLKHDRTLILASIIELELKQSPDDLKFLDIDLGSSIAPIATIERKKKKIHSTKSRIRHDDQLVNGFSAPKVDLSKLDLYDYVSDSDEVTSSSDTEEPVMSMAQLLQLEQTKESQQIGTIHANKIDPKIPAFRGRARIGRGGRLIFDRRPQKHQNGIVHYVETDDDCNPRFDSLMSYMKSPFGPVSVGQSDPEQLLKQLEALTAKKMKLIEKLSKSQAI